jgi:hypothetical protein
MAKLGQDGKQAEAKSGLALAIENNTSAEEVARMVALTEAIKGQGELTGIKWVDGWNKVIRPAGATVAFLLILLEAVSLISPIPQDTKSLMAGMIGFFFMNRTQLRVR